MTDFPLSLPHSRTRTRTARATATTNSTFLLLVLVVAVLNLIGLMMVLSASSVLSLRQNGNSWTYFEKQLLWVGIGSVLMAIAMRMNYRHWRRWVPILLLASGAMLLAVLIPGVGVRVSGSTRWLGAGMLRIQPSELAKFALLLFCADLLTTRSKQMDDKRVTLYPLLMVFVFAVVLVMLQPDMGTTLVMTIIVFSVLFVGGTPMRLMAAVAGSGVVAATLFGIIEPYRRARLTSFLHPLKDAGNGGYQVVQSLVGLSTGKLTGVGLGASRSKWGYLPNAHTDFIFSVIAEELGLIGAVAVVGLFVFLAYLGVRTAMRAPDRFGALLAAGITAWIIGQAIINIGAVIGILPVTGVPLPFVSFGGSSLLVIMTATGILLNIARQGRSRSTRTS